MSNKDQFERVISVLTEQNKNIVKAIELAPERTVEFNGLLAYNDEVIEKSKLSVEVITILEQAAKPKKTEPKKAEPKKAPPKPKVNDVKTPPVLDEPTPSAPINVDDLF